MNRKILIAGSGFLGLRTAAAFLADGFYVYAIVRTEEKAGRIRELGIRPILANLETGEGLSALPEVDAAVFCAAPDNHDELAYRTLYLNGAQRFIQALHRTKRNLKLIYTSSTSVWGNTSPENIIDESIPARATSEKGLILLEAENLFFSSGLPSCVIRLAGLYGDGRNRVKDVLEKKWPDFEADKYINYIHVADAVEIIKLCYHNHIKDEILIGSDGFPVQASALYQWLCAKLKIESTRKISDAGVSGKRYSNVKLRSYGMVFKFPDYRAGYSDIIQKMNASKLI